jgi:biotin carboxyl carrier protein
MRQQSRASVHLDIPDSSADSAVQSTNPRVWIALTALIAAMVVVAIWSFTARVPQQIRTEGVISASDALVEVVADAEGTITYSTPIGDAVQAGEVLAVIRSPQGDREVLAPAGGELQQRDLIEGSAVSAGQRVARIEKTNDATALTAVVYLTLDEKGLVREGTPAVVSIPTSSGAIINVETELTSVARSPSTVEAIAVDSGSISVAESVIAEMGGFSFRAAAPVDTSEADFGGGSVGDIGPGTLVQFVITYAKPRPIDLLFGR